MGGSGEGYDAMIRQTGVRVAVFLRAVVVLAIAAVGVPLLLVAASSARFGGGAPLHGVPAPTDWQFDRVKRALTDPLTDRTIADIVIRIALVTAWIAVAVLVLTVLIEVVHMIRHRGLAMPDIRGLGVPQSIARLIATGLLVVVPAIAAPTRAAARDGVQLVPRQRAIPTVESLAGYSAPSDESGLAANPAIGLPGVEPGRYIVRAGDSIYAIAERVAGPDPAAVADYAQRLLELNLDTTMPDGQRFVNAAFVDVGWVLQLPSLEADADPVGVATNTHVVEQGESLWSIADDELGDGRRWPEIFESNEGRVFDDGRRLADPDLIQPDWTLDLPPVSTDQGGADPDPADAVAGDRDPVVAAMPPVPAGPDNVWVSSPLNDVAEPSPGPAHGVEDGDSAPVAVAPGGDGGADLGGVTTGEAEPSDGQSVVPASPGAEQPESAAPATLPAAPTQSGVDGGTVDRSAIAPQPDDQAPGLLTLSRAAMLSAGVLTLLGVRRRNQLRRARPRSRLPIASASTAATERGLRSGDAGDGFDLVRAAIDSVADDLVAQGQRVVAASVGSGGELEFRFSGPVDLSAPWQGAGEVWRLSDSANELPAGRPLRAVPTCPTLVQLGRDVDGRDVFVDLEACAAIEIGGRPESADAIVAAIAMTLAASPLAEATTLVGLGVPDAAFLGHRMYVSAHDDVAALQIAGQAVGPVASAGTSTFALRAGSGAVEAWEPAVVLVGSTAGSIRSPRVPTGLAVVSASPIIGPSSRLAPDGDAWALHPIGIRLTPIGVSPEELVSVAELVDVAEPVLVLPFPPDSPPAVVDPDVEDRPGAAASAVDHADAQPSDIAGDGSGESSAGPDADATDFEGDGLAGLLDVPAAVVRPADLDPWEVVTSVWRPAAMPAWELQVRLIGPVEVICRSGGFVEFERSKTRELVAWLATHRNRSTRTAARTALWELDVRDATFSNVVSEARRSLARLVEPPDGEEWVGRTMTEALPLHELVVTDADLIEQALEAARLQPPAQAIATLAPVVDLINGMPFEGTSYLWPDAEGITSNLVLLATSAAAELAAHCLSLGDIDGVFRATGRGLQVLPGHEQLIGLRMQAHAGAGDRAGVRQEWESYERVITADPWSDGEPASKLVELRQRLLNPAR